MRRRTLGVWIVLLLVMGVGGLASARLLWIPVAGPMFKRGARYYFTVKTTLVSPTGGTASGTVKLDCNAGDDADRLIVRASGLPANAACKVWFSEESKGKRLGEPFETVAGSNGEIKFTVYGSLCYLKEYPHLVIVVNNKVALQSDLRAAIPRPTPSARPTFGLPAPTGSPSSTPSETPAPPESPAPSESPSPSDSPLP